jgi:hypothetical protein
VLLAVTLMCMWCCFGHGCNCAVRQLQAVRHRPGAQPRTGALVVAGLLHLWCWLGQDATVRCDGYRLVVAGLRYLWCCCGQGSQMCGAPATGCETQARGSTECRCVAANDRDVDELEVLLWFRRQLCGAPAA